VEQVRAVAVHLDAGLRLGLGVGVAADVVAALQHRTRLSSSDAARSAIVSPKKPDPTINRS
jgi:hypothetical protein